MAKAIVSVYMDADLIDKIRARETNVSGYIEKLVRGSVDGDLENPILLKELNEAKEVYGQQKESLDRLKDLIDGLDSVRKTERAKFFESLPELLALTPQQINNNDFMLEFVSNLREKTGKRIGLLQIHEWLNLKAAQKAAAES